MTQKEALIGFMITIGLAVLFLALAFGGHKRK